MTDDASWARAGTDSSSPGPGAASEVIDNAGRSNTKTLKALAGRFVDDHARALDALSRQWRDSR